MTKPPRTIPATLEELRDEHDRQREASIKAGTRWAISVTVGNGAALTLLGGRSFEWIASDHPNASWLLAFAFPSLICFAFGLVLGATGGLFDQLAALKRLSLLEERESELQAGVGNLQREIRPFTLADQGLAFWTEVLAGACFALGLIIPLGQLLLRYWTAGGTF